MSDRTVVVTGATGFIGWNLCESLRDSGWRVRAAVRPSSRNPLPPGIERRDAGLSRDEMAPVIEGADAVVHLAGLTRAASYAEFERVNADGAAEVARAAADVGAFMLLVSSMAASGPATTARPARETDTPAPVSLYGQSKLAGERALTGVRELRWAVLRPPGVYGPRDTDFLPLFRLGRRGLFPLLGSASTGYSLVHVSDLVVAMVALVAAGIERRVEVEREIFFVGHPEAVTASEMRDALGRVFERRIRTLRVPRAALWALSQLGELAAAAGRPALMNRSRYRELTAPGFVCDASKLEAAVGWRARYGVGVGFDATANWYRRHRLL